MHQQKDAICNSNLVQNPSDVTIIVKLSPNYTSSATPDENLPGDDSR